jgi:hypothetical protein
MKMTLGCDPELFLKDVTTGNFISSIGNIGGSKDFPRPIDDLGNAVQEDNVAVEFNTPPCSSAVQFIEHINRNKDWITTRAKHFNCEPAIIPSAVFSDDQLDSFEAQQFGCEPDFNAWLGGKVNKKPSAVNPNLRSAGGHIHIALEDDDDCLEVIKAMDLFVGCQMLKFDTDTARRELYGKAGAFRKKSYGVEYRTASNAWIVDDERIQWAWDQTEKALSFVREGFTIDEEWGEKIQQCINDSNTDLLEEINQVFGIGK